MSYQQFDEIQWEAWTPSMRATLVFVVEQTRVLLIRKKRGLGAGKINAPGGRIEDGETPVACAIREAQEEVGVTPLNLERSGEHSFQFTDGLALHVVVFRASGYEGSLIETDEAKPMWFPLDSIPFDEMWADDRLWIPLMLQRKPFNGRWLFDDERIVDYVLEGAP